MEVNTDTLSVMGATLANGGLCPTTGEKIFNGDCVRNVLSLMFSCGMYNYSGEFAFKVRIVIYIFSQSSISCTQGIWGRVP
jgi:glutaminase